MGHTIANENLGVRDIVRITVSPSIRALLRITWRKRQTFSKRSNGIIHIEPGRYMLSTVSIMRRDCKRLASRHADAGALPLLKRVSDEWVSWKSFVALCRCPRLSRSKGKESDVVCISLWVSTMEKSILNEQYLEEGSGVGR